MMKKLKKRNAIKIKISKIVFSVIICMLFLQTSSHAADMPDKMSYTDYIKNLYKITGESASDEEELIKKAKEDYANHYTPYVDAQGTLGLRTTGNSKDPYYSGNFPNVEDEGGNLVVSDDINEYMETLGLSIGCRANESNGAYKNTIQYLPIMQKFGEMYGVDPYIAVAIACQESGGVHSEKTFRKSAGCGLMQIEAPGDNPRVLKCKNLLTGEIDSVDVNYETMTEPDAVKNIQAGIMILSGKIKEFENNTPLFLQSYNYGAGGAKKVVKLYIDGEEVGKTLSEITKDSSILGWMGYRKFPHEDPRKHIASSWSEGQCKIADCPNKGNHASGCTFGDPHYVERILSYYHQSTT